MQIEETRFEGKNRLLTLQVCRQIIFVFFFSIIDIGFKYASLGVASIESVIASIISGVLLSIVLGFIFSNLSYGRRARIGVAWLSLFVIQYFSNFVEAVFFTTAIPDALTFIAASITGLIISFLEATLTGLLFGSGTTNDSLNMNLAKYFDNGSSTDWAQRIIVSSLVYFPIYYIFGSIIAPMVLRYYNDPTQGLGLVVPSLGVIVPLEFLRGFLYVVALIPIIASLKVSSRTMFLCLTSFIFIVGSFVPFIAYSTLPAFLRLVHGAEILVDSIAYGAVLTYLLRSPLVRSDGSIRSVNLSNPFYRVPKSSALRKAKQHSRLSPAIRRCPMDLLLTQSR